MKIGLISSWNEKCGVSEYTRNLAQGLIDKDNDVKICANYPKDQVQPDEDYVKRLFHVEFMTNQRGADAPGILEFFADRDIIHIQFEAALYHPSWFVPFMREMYTKLKAKIVVTTHTAAMWPEFDARCVHHFITHSQMWSTQSLIPPGVKFFDKDARFFDTMDEYVCDMKSVVSFGLGRNQDNLIKEAIEGTDVTFRTTYGNNKWLSKEELIKEIKKSWIISLMYPEIDNTLSSSAVILAMGCNRPILISNTNWFQHVINYPNLYVCETVQDIKDNIKYLTDPKNLPSIESDLCLMRAMLVMDNRTYDHYINEHIKVYTALI